MNARNPWPHWVAAALIGLPACYLLTCGLACGLTRVGLLSNDQADTCFRPILELASCAPPSAENFIYELLFGHSADRQKLNRFFKEFEGISISEPEIGYRSEEGWKELIAKRDRLRAARRAAGRR